MKVYVVENADWESNTIYAIFDNQKAADEYAEDCVRRHKAFDEGWELNPGGDNPIDCPDGPEQPLITAHELLSRFVKGQ